MINTNKQIKKQIENMRLKLHNQIWKRVYSPNKETVCDPIKEFDKKSYGLLAGRVWWPIYNQLKELKNNEFTFR